MNDMQKVDVLAVMDEFVAVVGDEFGNDPALRLRAARVALAELIAAARDAAAILQSKAGPLEQETPRRLYAALARVGGVA